VLIRRLRKQIARQPKPLHDRIRRLVPTINMRSTNYRFNGSGRHLTSRTIQPIKAINEVDHTSGRADAGQIVIVQNSLANVFVPLA
jgi:hypothetical protein